MDHVSEDAEQLLRDAVSLARRILDEYEDPAGAGAVMRGFVLSPTFKEIVSDEVRDALKGVGPYMPDAIAETLAFLSEIDLAPPRQLVTDPPTDISARQRVSRQAAFDNMFRGRNNAA